MEQAQLGGEEEAITRVWRRAKDVRNWHDSLSQMNWADDATLRYIQKLAKATISEDEKDRLAAWQDKMDWCDKDAINWIKEGEDTPQGAKISALVD